MVSRLFNIIISPFKSDKTAELNIQPFEEECVDVINELGTLYLEPVKVTDFLGEGLVYINGAQYEIKKIGAGSFKKAYVANITEVGRKFLDSTRGKSIDSFPVGTSLVFAEQDPARSPSIDPRTLAKFQQIPYLVAPRPVIGTGQLLKSTDKWQVSDYCSEGDATKFLSSPKGRDWAATHKDEILGLLLFQLAETHKLNIVLRDIKPDNIFVAKKGDSYHFCLADLDLHEDLDLAAPSKRFGLKGSPAFISIPCWTTSRANKLDNSEIGRDILKDSDVWGLGLSLYKVFNNSSPPFLDEMLDLRRRNPRERELPPRPEITGLDPPASLDTADDFVQLMISKKRTDCPLAPELWAQWKSRNPELAEKIEQQRPLS